MLQHSLASLSQLEQEISSSLNQQPGPRRAPTLFSDGSSIYGRAQARVAVNSDTKTANFARAEATPDLGEGFCTEGHLILYYTSCLILNAEYEQAARALEPLL